MADPGTIALATSIIGTGMQVVGGLQQASASKAANRANAEIAARNAAIAASEGERARMAAGEQAREKRKEARRLLARQTVLYAKSGVKPETGTPLIVSEETKKQLARQAAIVQEQGDYAYSYGMSQAGIYGEQESLYGKMARSAGRMGLWSTGTTLATGLSQTALLKYQFDLDKKKKKGL